MAKITEEELKELLLNGEQSLRYQEQFEKALGDIQQQIKQLRDNYELMVPFLEKVDALTGTKKVSDFDTEIKKLESLDVKKVKKIDGATL